MFGVSRSNVSIFLLSHPQSIHAGSHSNYIHRIAVGPNSLDLLSLVGFDITSNKRDLSTETVCFHSKILYFEGERGDSYDIVLDNYLTE